MAQLAETRYDSAFVTIEAAPADGGRLELIVRRPRENERELLEVAQLDLEDGLIGDRWAQRQAENPVYLDAQLTVISTRLLAAIEPDRGRWPIAGDQLYVDLDLREETLPPGSRVAIGSAVIEISEAPHTGCAKFGARFGSEALRWINSPIGRAHRLRGLNARIVEAGTVRVGDAIHRLRGPAAQDERPRAGHPRTCRVVTGDANGDSRRGGTNLRGRRTEFAPDGTA